MTNWMVTPCVVLSDVFRVCEIPQVPRAEQLNCLTFRGFRGSGWAERIVSVG